MVTLQKTDLIGFASTFDVAKSLIDAGITHLILESPLLSIRSWATPHEFDNLESLSVFTDKVRNYKPQIKLSVQMDFLMHDSHTMLVEQVIQFCKLHKIEHVRVQDVGILYKMHKESIHCVYDSQMGNMNWVSVDGFKSYADRQCLSMEMAASDIELIYAKTQAKLELVVHGQICIQYSQRRFLAGFFDESSSAEHLAQYHQLAEDYDYPGRRFTFLDNEHGHFMFAYFDRSLLNDIEQLKKLPLVGWIIDTRGYDLAYQVACVQAYSYCLSQHTLDDQQFDDYYNRVKSLASKPLKPGFFRANQTDRRRYKKRTAFLLPTESVAATVLDIWEKKWIVLQCHQVIKKGSTCYAKHPKIETCNLDLSELYTLDHQPVDETYAEQLIKIPWVKGIQQQSLLIVA